MLDVLQSIINAVGAAIVVPIIIIIIALILRFLSKRL